MRDTVMRIIARAAHEMYAKLEGEESQESSGSTGTAPAASVLAQILLLDIVFSLDSVITAVGMANQLWVMVAAIS